MYINIEFFETVAHVRGEMNTPLECRWLCVVPMMLIVSSLAGKLEREIIDDQWINDQNTKESNDHRVYVSTDNHSDQFDPVYNEGQW